MQTLKQQARKKILNLANGTEHLLTQKAVNILMKMPDFSKRYKIEEGDYIYDVYGKIVEAPNEPARAPAALTLQQEVPQAKPQKTAKTATPLINLTQDEK